MAEKDDYLADVLVDLGVVNADQVAKTRQEAETSGVGVVDLLLANKLVKPSDVTQAKAAQFVARQVTVAGNFNNAKKTIEVADVQIYNPSAASAGLQ